MPEEFETQPPPQPPPYARNYAPPPPYTPGYPPVYTQAGYGMPPRPRRSA